MFKIKQKFLTVAVLLLLAVNISAHDMVAEGDSLFFTKHILQKSKYNVNHTALRKISIVNREPKAVSTDRFKFLKHLVDVALVLFLGGSSTRSEEAMCTSKNKLRSSDAAYTWRVPLSFPGQLITNRDQVDNRRHSITSKKILIIDWSKGADGLIIEKGDTLGKFTLNTSLKGDSASLDWLSKIRVENIGITDRWKKRRPLLKNYDFMVDGVFRGQTFKMVTSGNHYKSLIMMGTKPEAVFQSNPSFIILRKKNRIAPFIFFSKKVDEGVKIDLIRLALLNTLLIRCLSVDSYDK